jgi:uridine kinase
MGDEHMDVHIVAVAGGSCSGKTRIANHTSYALGENLCAIVRQDHYYLDYGGAAQGEPLPNFDHPDAFEWDLLCEQLVALKQGKTIEVPTYDFVTHRRQAETQILEPRPIVLVEGILVLSQPKLCALFERSFFVSCDEDVRLMRRLKRDVAERGRTPESVHEQFAGDVTPMHDKFVEPSKHEADTIITQDQCELSIITSTGPLISYCNSVL